MDPARLAIEGGSPAVPQGPPPWPIQDLDVHETLNAAAADGSWGRYHGPHVERLQEIMAAELGLPHVYPCCSGTFAVELALRALRVGPGDEVLLAGYDFGGNFRAIEAVGAWPLVVDVNSRNWTLEPAALDAVRGPNTRTAIVSHLHGGLAPMSELCGWAESRGISIVEDACQAAGATVQGRAAGAWGDVGVFSFGGSKLLTSGRGGAIVTRHAEVWQRAKILCEQGNHAYPLSELQAAVLAPQWKKLAARHAKRRHAAARLLAGLAKIAALQPLVNPSGNNDPAYYKLGLSLDSARLGNRPRQAVIAALQAEGVAVDAGFRGFTQRGESRCRHAGPLVESRRASQSALVLHHPVLLEPDAVIDQVAAAFQKVFQAWGD